MATTKAPNSAYQAMLAEAAKRRALAKKLAEEGKTMDYIGAALGVSKQRASQLVGGVKKKSAAG